MFKRVELRAFLGSLPDGEEQPYTENKMFSFGAGSVRILQDFCRDVDINGKYWNQQVVGAKGREDGNRTVP